MEMARSSLRGCQGSARRGGLLARAACDRNAFPAAPPPVASCSGPVADSCGGSAGLAPASLSRRGTARSLAEPPCDFSRFSQWQFGRIVALRTLVPRWRLPMPSFPEKSRIAMVLFRGLTQLDLTGPFEIFARMPGAAIDLVSKAPV